MHSKLNDSQILSIRSAYWSGTPVKEICKIYGISESTAYFWISPNQYKEYAADLGMEIMIHKEFCDTQRSMQKLRKIVDILNDANCNSESPLEEKLSEFVRLSPIYGINVTLEALHISKGTYHNRIICKHNPTCYELHHKEISEAVQHIFDESEQCYGSDKILAVLKRRGYRTSKKYVLNIMHELGLESIRIHSKKEYYALHRKNKVKRQFDVSAPNTVWVSDITKFKIKGIYYHVCVVMDLFSRKVVGYKISPNASTQIVTSSFKMAFKERGYPVNLLFHSDQGCQYTSKAFRKLLTGCSVDQSFSHTGTPIDNAVSESFFSNLKKEEMYRHDYRSEREFKTRISRYIAHYNQNRPHSYNNYRSPDEKETQYYTHLAE